MVSRSQVDSIDVKLLQLPWKKQGNRLILEGMALATAHGLIKKPGFYERIALLVRQAGAEMAQIKCPGQKHGFRVPAAACDSLQEHKQEVKTRSQLGDLNMTNFNDKPSLFIGVMRMGIALRPQMDYILSNPTKKLALTRISDNAQLMLSEASAQAFKSNGEEAVTRKTSDFWLDADLEVLQQMYRDYGSIGFELTYTASLDKPKNDPTAAWGKFTTRYKLVEDEFGIVYRQGEILELVEIERPLVFA